MDSHRDSLATRPLRVTYVLDALVSGGAERQLALLLQYLDRQEWEPRLVTFVDGQWRDRFAALDLPIDLVPYSKGKPATVVGTLRALRRHRPDIVHAFGHTSNYVGRLAAIMARVPVIIVSERSAPDHIKSAAVLMVDYTLGPFTDHLIANSEHAARFYLRRHILPASKVSVVPNGISVPPPPARPGRGRGQRQVATVGDFRPEKNMAELVAAVKILVDRDCALTLNVIGDGVGRAECEAEVRSQQLGRNVVFHGYVDDVLALLQKMDLYVHTARYEGFPNSVMEAMAVGVPCVVFDAAWSLELIGRDERGVVVGMGDTPALARAIEDLLGDEARAQCIGERGRQFVENELTIPRMVSDTVAIYRSLLGGRSRLRAGGRVLFRF